MSSYHLGINMGHDRSVAVVKDGEIVVAIEQERLDRIKHSVGFMLQAPDAMGQIQVPGESIAYCLDYLGLPLSEMSTITPNMPGVDMAPDILRGKFSQDVAAQVRTIPSHHLAHAYSVFWPSGFEEALVLVVDASGTTLSGPDGRRTESYTLYEGRGTELNEVHSEAVTPHLATLSTLGFVYEAVSRRAGFVTNLNSGLSFPEAGKLMGLAAYGGPQPNWEQWFSKDEDSHAIQMSAYDIFLEMAALEKRYDDGQGKPYSRPWLVDLAYKVQAELEKVLCQLVSDACQQTGLKRVCLAGGVGLNSVANYKILRECELEDIFIFPAAADNGIAVGCALWGYHTEEGGTERPPLGTACFGRRYNVQEVDDAIKHHEDLLEVEKLDPGEMIHCVAEALSKGNIVARYEGRAEFGPRALGHRSILADPTFKRMKDVVNARAKFREAFRPFAPFVPLDRANEVFELKSPSPYMLLVAPVREKFRAKLPAITHEDGTGRVQTCTPEQNPFFHALCLEAERLRGGSPVLLNTSFNVAGQPIVEAPLEAIETFLHTDIDYLSLDNRWIRRRHQPVKDYNDHILDLEFEKAPHGLKAGQAGVRPLMEELDAAIFHGIPSQHWNEAEVAALSARGARFKETSVLFQAQLMDLIAPLETQLGPDATLILDPVKSSVLVDETGRQSDVPLDMDRVKTILALRQPPQPIRDELRLQLGATPAELDDLVEEMAATMDRFQIPVNDGWRDSDSMVSPKVPLPESGKTFGAFEDESFRVDEQLRSVRRAIIGHGYEESSICELLDVDSLQGIEPTRLRYHDAHTLPETPLSDLVRLFQLRSSVPRKRVERIFDPEDLDFLTALGLLDDKEGSIWGGVDLFCSGGLLFATDHRYMIRADDSLDEDQVMYIGMDSHGLVQTAPQETCDRVLDLCCGSGVQGLVASRYARSVMAVDLNPRAVRFARFNAQLNGIGNYEVRLGSLYEVVEGETFDCILANPPFVPSPETSLKFRDGGATGEDILRAIVEGSWTHLNPEGRLCIVTDLVDIDTYEPKLKSWLGEVNAYGLILTTADRNEILFAVPHCHAPFSQSFADYNAELDSWVENFRSTGLKAVNFGYILAWKHSGGDGCDITKRTIHNPATPIWKQVQDWLEQRRLWDSDDAGSLVLAMHPELRIVTAESPGGGFKSCELHFPDNAFFTTYAVSNAIADELRRIHMTEPTLSRRFDAPDSAWIETLHRLGVLRLATTRRSFSGESSPDPGDTAGGIEERATKTTPTCLSSYLG
ncbi:MAG: carbamoyltransferase C-terminal domain-containing protein [Planctomycetota bacterium]|nr:carbamoyltransferase C-terminal domain-containing protein [Planctomycetota bacterium]